ncbi:hypothetical protein GCM10010052_42210 [Paenarthrobacter histidinolovorans]|nr:hypothetical protein GCM10010052_42210 [Paenarthrobacter histidinolovorans]
MHVVDALRRDAFGAQALDPLDDIAVAEILERDVAYGMANVQFQNPLVRGDRPGGGPDKKIDMFLDHVGNSQRTGPAARRLGFWRSAVALKMFDQAEGFLLGAYA